MFNRFSNWCNKHQGFLTFLSLIAIFYVAYSKSINATISKIFNISLNGLNSFLNHKLTVGDSILILLLYILLKYLWNYFRRKEITIIKAIYYTNKNSLDITDKIKTLVEKEGQYLFQISNELAGDDPEFGTGKKFDIEYLVGKDFFKKSYVEHDFVKIV